jgi:hypothetical protein
MKELIQIQSELKAPKNQFNAFGKYKYRNCEDILEALKPLLLKYECTLTITDEIKQVGEWIYVEATASIQKGEEGRTVTAQAGITPDRKGMDLSQSFGASSSYARKYALNGLFLIDDTKDADTTNIQGAVKPEMTPSDALWSKAVAKVASGESSIDKIRKAYLLTDENEKQLLKEAGKL